jgi:phage replication O-like protein O
MEKLAVANVTGREAKVVAAVARKTFGFRKREDELAASQIAKLTGIGRSHVAEILAALEDRQIIVRTGGTAGRAAVISLNLATDWEPVPSTGHLNLSRTQDTSSLEPVPQTGTKPVPLKGHTRGKGVKHSRSTHKKTAQNRIVDAYCGAGGNLELDSWRGSLLRQATELAKKHPEDLILAAAASLGREQEFPGYLKQRVAELKENGGPCQWGTLDRSRLTPDQLAECSCHHCQEWANAPTTTR